MVRFLILSTLDKEVSELTMERRIFAHRGLNRVAPENTLAAFEKTADAGLTWIETDVDILGDGTPIVIHDTSLDRTTNRSGSYYGLEKADLASIDAGSWFSPEFTGQPLPTLEQLIELLNRRGLNANIEIKSNEAGGAMSMRLIDSILDALTGLDPEREVFFSSFNHVLLAKIKERAPQYEVGCLYETCALYDDWKSMLELVGASYIHPEDRGLTKSKVEAFREAGFGVNVWTVNSIDRAHELFNWGATGVFTDVADSFAHLQ